MRIVPTQQPDEIYLDHAATTPADPRVIEAMIPWLGTRCANTANRSHARGRAAIAAVEHARQQLADLIGAASPAQIVFTSGATEATCLVMRGLAAAPDRPASRSRIVVSATEHRSVSHAAASLLDRGIELVVAPVDRAGRLDLTALAALVDHRTLLVSVHAANNEIGAVQDIPAIAAIARAVGALVHTDAVQQVGKLPVDVQAWDVDFLSLSGHKFYGPQGVGALYVRAGASAEDSGLVAQAVGGGHERGLRSGTLNVAGIVGIGVAAQLARTETIAAAPRVALRRDRFEHQLLALRPEFFVNAAEAPRLPTVISVTCSGVDGGRLVEALPGLALSRGSACSTGSAAPSHVLSAIGLAPEEAFSTLRLSIGHDTTDAYVDSAVDQIRTALSVLAVSRTATGSPLQTAIA